MAKRAWLSIQNAASGGDAAEIMIYDRIGKDFLGDGGIAAKEFGEALAQIPKGRSIRCRINSIGGNVWDGMAIYSLLKERREQVMCIVDGVAASIASVIACAGKRTVMPKNALMMVHAPYSFCEGDAAKMRAMADRLEAHKKAICSVYAEKTGKSDAEIAAVMDAGEKWFTGEEAKAFGLCDDCTEEEAAMNAATDFDFSQFRCVPAVLRGKPGNQAAGWQTPGRAEERDSMNKNAILNLLKEHGMEVPSDATDEVILAKLAELGTKAKEVQAAASSPQLTDLENKLKDITTALDNERRATVTAAVQACIDEARIPAESKDKWVTRALADQTVLDDLRKLPSKPPGAAPLMGGLEVLSEDSRNVVKAMTQHLAKPGDVAGIIGGAPVRNVAIGSIYRKERERLLPVLNAGTNTISSDLKRVLILNEIVRAFALRVLPLRAFATVFENVALQGTDEVVVPYYPLRADASTDWNASNGYVFSGTNEVSSVKVTVNKRKYQPIDFTSNEFRRQPFLDLVRFRTMNAEKLGYDVLIDILSEVTLANYGAAVYDGGADAFDSDDIADLYGIANDLNWPEAGRSLIVNTAHDTALKKDPSYKLALNIGGTEIIRTGKVPNIGGFDYYYMPNFPTNSEKLAGVMAHASALAVATAPVDPAPGVRDQLMAYETVTDAATGITMNYRAWGDPQMDKQYETIETAYGYKKLLAAALKRICTP